MAKARPMFLTVISSQGLFPASCLLLMQTNSQPPVPTTLTLWTGPRVWDWAWGVEPGKGKGIHCGEHACSGLPMPDPRPRNLWEACLGIGRPRHPRSYKVAWSGKFFRKHKVLSLNSTSLQPGDKFANAGKIFLGLSDAETIHSLGWRLRYSRGRFMAFIRKWRKI